MATLASMTVRLGIDTDRLRAGAERAVGLLKNIGKSVAQLGVGVPAAAAVATALGGIAAAAAAAGIAVGAFKLAVAPQLEAVKNVAELAAAAEEAAAAGGEKAAEATKAYNDALAKLPPATQQTAKAFIGLKKNYAAWSDALASDTMPVLTKGLRILKELLPALTPFVRGAAEAMSGFLDDVAKGVRSAGFKQWAKDMGSAAGPALRDFLTVIGNFAVGFGALVAAFLPASDNMTGGLVKASQAFRDWATSLQGSAGFDKFIDLAKQGAKTIGALASAAVNLLVALGPLIGITTMIALQLANMINALPPEVLNAAALAIAAVVVGMKLYALYTTIVATATKVWAAAQWLMNTALFASPITWIVLAIIALIAIIVLIATKTTWFQTAWDFVWNAVKAAVVWAVEQIIKWLSFLGQLPDKIAKWFGQAKDYAIEKFVALVAWLAGLPGRAWRALSDLGSKLWGRMKDAGQRMMVAAGLKIAEVVRKVRALPDKAKAALGGLGSKLWGAGKSLIQGFINGIRSMIGSVRDTLGGLTSSLTSWKGPPRVDARILMPAGSSLIAGFQRGISGQVPYLRRQLQSVTADLPGMTATVSGVGAAARAGRDERRLVLDVTGADEDMKKLIRKMVRVDGRGGNVQAAFGR